MQLQEPCKNHLSKKTNKANFGYEKNLNGSNHDSKSFAGNGKDMYSVHVSTLEVNWNSNEN